MNDEPIGLPVAETDGSTCDLYEEVEYTRYWWRSDRLRRDMLEKAIVRRLLPAHGKRLIDVGCGFGRLADSYVNRFEQVIMLDGSLSLLRQARERTEGRLVYIAADLLHIPLRSAACDSLLMIRVMQHMPDPDACLAELHRVACGDATLVMSYCNKRSLATLVRWLGHSADHPWHPLRRETMQAHYGSPFYYHHPETMDKMIRGAKFAPIGYLGAGKIEESTTRLGHIDRRLRLGLLLSELLGRSRLSGWIFTRSESQGEEPLRPATELTDLLQCPACAGAVQATAGGYGCGSCGRSYPVVDGIADFRLNADERSLDAGSGTEEQ